MTVSLLDANGRNVSMFGTGNSQFAQGTDVNTAQFGQTSLFGKGTSTTTPATTSSTKAGSTQAMGYTDLTTGSRHGIHQAPMTASAPQVEPPSVNAETQGDTSPIQQGIAAIRKHQVQKAQDAQDVAQSSRTDEFGAGASSGRPGGDVPGGMAGAEDAVEDLGEVL